MSNQNPYIEEEQTTQWSEGKVQKDKQRSTKRTHKAKNRVTRTPLKTGGELRYSERVSSSCSTSGTRHVNLELNYLQNSTGEVVVMSSLTLYLLIVFRRVLMKKKSLNNFISKFMDIMNL